jgi:hypothetical protein
METQEEKKPIVEEARIPESLTINGVTYKVNETPELQALIQSVAKVEKNKLYSKFEELKAQIDNLKNASIEGVGSINAETLETLKGIFLTKEDFQNILPDTLRTVVSPILQSVEKTQQDELAAYRQKLITENANTCIPDLVKGNTKEELDASLAESIRLRAAYPSPSTSAPQGKTVDPLIQAQAKTAETIPTPTQPAAMPTVPQRPAAQPGGQPEVKGMSMEEFAKNRAQLKQQLDALYGSGQ